MQNSSTGMTPPTSSPFSFKFHTHKERHKIDTLFLRTVFTYQYTDIVTDTHIEILVGSACQSARSIYFELELVSTGA